MGSISRAPSRARLAACTIALLLAGACGTSGEAGGAAPASSTPAPALAPALAAGPLARGKAATVTDGPTEMYVIAYRYRQLESQVPPNRGGYVYAGVRARLCVDRAPAPVEVSWEGWELVYPDSTLVEPVNAWSEDWFSVPLFPGAGFEKAVRAGRCVEGWIVFEVRKGSRPDLVEYAPEGSTGAPSMPAAWDL